MFLSLARPSGNAPRLVSHSHIVCRGYPCLVSMPLVAPPAPFSKRLHFLEEFIPFHVVYARTLLPECQALDLRIETTLRRQQPCYHTIFETLSVSRRFLT